MKRVPSFSQQSFPIPVLTHQLQPPVLMYKTSYSLVWKHMRNTRELQLEQQEKVQTLSSFTYCRNTNFSSEFGQEQQHVLICKLKALTKALWIGDVAMTPLLFLAKLPQKLTADFRCATDFDHSSKLWLQSMGIFRLEWLIIWGGENESESPTCKHTIQRQCVNTLKIQTSRKNT